MGTGCNPAGLIAWGLARCAQPLRAGRAGIVLSLRTMIASTLASTINLAHACEAVLIGQTPADHEAGRRSRALALLAACLFMKAVMAYIYGFPMVRAMTRTRAGSPAIRSISIYFMRLIKYQLKRGRASGVGEIRAIGSRRRCVA
jgi:hypothetical protein